MRIECEVRRALSQAMATAVNEVAQLSISPGSNPQTREEAHKRVRNARNAYWEHVREHGCRDATERLKAINQKAGPE